MNNGSLKYVYETLNYEDDFAIRNFNVPAFLDPEDSKIITLNSFLYLGGTFTGSPVQLRKHYWNQLVYGRSRVFLYPPSAAFYSREAIRSWFLREKKDASSKERDRFKNTASGLLECVQLPGDVLYVPESWSMGYMHTQESVGVASEFIFGTTEFTL